MVLELVMKLLTEDQKKYTHNMEKAVSSYRKLWEQYQESTLNIASFNKLSQKNLMDTYLQVLSREGWESLKKALQSLHGRHYISKRIIKESKGIMDELKTSAKIAD
jgi:hypothetical protein